MSATAIPAPSHSIIEFFYPPDTEGHRCGYCKSSDTNFTNGMWAHVLSPENYESLINIGWRRSGLYVYKPMNEKICCPMYTIRNLSTKVEISRSQRKVLKKFKKYLSDGIVSGGKEGKSKRTNPGKESDEERMNDSHIEAKSGMDSANLASMKDEGHQHCSEMALDPPKDKEAASAQVEGESKSESNVQAQISPSTSTEKKTHPLKRKFLRRERKKQKLIAKGLDPDEFFRRNERNRVKELGEFFTNDSTYKHRFMTKLVRVDSSDFTDEVFTAEHSLYQKYQMTVHGDTPRDCRDTQFKRFLCDNPFGGAQWLQSPSPIGLFHQHYYIDSNLIAVGVIDILPHCVSSVYFFYDPDFAFLSPGTLGALHEMYFVNELNKKNPALQYYYLGFYIHTCVKMRYKRKFRPCELVCPVTYQWVKFDDRVLKLLDNQKFAKLYDGNDSDWGQQDVNKVLLLHKNCIFSYPFYPKRQEQAEELNAYVNLVSSAVASNMLLFRPK